MVMWYIEQVPEYKALVDDCLDQVERHVGTRHGGMRYRKAYLFLSAPGATTPAHFDPEQNLELQIRGTNDFTVGRFASPANRQSELDRYFDGGHRNLDHMPEVDQAFHMNPGDGVYVPPFAPHWVHVPGEQASISLSITFRTRASLEMERVSNFNARIRRLGLSPRPAGVSPSRDRLKASLVETLTTLKGHRDDSEHGDPGSDD